MDDQLLVGEIGKPHGLAGDVYVVEISDDPRRFEPGSVLTHEDGRELTVQSAHRHGARFLIKFEAIDTREDAETLRGALYVPANARRDLAEDEYWERDLVGCAVVSQDGSALGTVVDIAANPAHPLLVVDVDGNTRLIPAVKDIVRRVDLEERRIMVDPPQGLLD